MQALVAVVVSADLTAETRPPQGNPNLIWDWCNIGQDRFQLGRRCKAVLSSWQPFLASVACLVKGKGSSNAQVRLIVMFGAKVCFMSPMMPDYETVNGNLCF